MRVSRLVLLGLLVALAGAWFWRYAVRDHVIPKRFGEVAAGKVYRSGKLTPAALKGVAEEHGIRTIVDLGAYELGSAEDRRAQRTAEALGLTRYRLDLIGDATGNPNYYVQALELMTDPARQPVLVHCGAGTERTGCAVLLYRHIVEGEPIGRPYEDEEFKEAVRAGHSPRRNPHLREVVEQWADDIARAFREKGQIDGAPPLPPARPVGAGSR